MISQGILFAHMMISFQQGRENRADIHKRWSIYAVNKLLLIVISIEITVHFLILNTETTLIYNKIFFHILVHFFVIKRNLFFNEVIRSSKEKKENDNKYRIYIYIYFFFLILVYNSTRV
jgi:hypothetical protein